MSLATRCVHCGTAFRVVRDQLKVSEGWVRCGRCDNVFNALEGLFDLDREGPISGSTPLGPAEPPPDGNAAVTAPEDPAGPALTAGAEASVAAPAESDLDMAPTQFQPHEAAALDPPLAFADDSRLGDEATPSQLEATESELAEAQALATPDDPAPTARFLRDAQRAAQWRRPRVRASLSLAAALLALALAAQGVLQHRDELAARWPSSVPALETLCDALACVIEAPRRMDALAVDSSALTRIEGSDLFRLQVTLRNRESQTVMAPALDLALTDSAGEAIIRRVLTLADFAPGAAQWLAPGGELALAAVIDVGPRRVSGYTIELFYP